MSETEKNFPIVTFDVHHELGSVGGRIAATGFLEHIACMAQQMWDLTDFPAVFF